jgi:hypothetical protein
MLKASELSKLIWDRAEEWKLSVSGMTKDDEAVFIFWNSLAAYNGAGNPKLAAVEMKEACGIAARIFVNIGEPNMPTSEFLEAHLLHETQKAWGTA